MAAAPEAPAPSTTQLAIRNVPVPATLIPAQSPGCGAAELLVKVIGNPATPLMFRLPVITIDPPELNVTDTPGSIDNVAPEFTMILLTTYGLPTSVRVVLVIMVRLPSTAVPMAQPLTELLHSCWMMYGLPFNTTLLPSPAIVP